MPHPRNEPWRTRRSRRIVVETVIRCPPERAFDAARDIDTHVESMRHTGERAVTGRTSGLIQLGEEVTWEAVHFGVRQRLTSRVTRFDRPRYFRDEMVRGAFARFVHDHHFDPITEGTHMTDVVEFASPLGLLGRLADRLVLRRYLEKLIRNRAEHIRRIASRAA